MRNQLPEPRSLRRQAADYLRQEILNGSMPPGVVIKEAELAQRLGISTIPLREALVQLAEEGLVLMEPNRSKTVAPLSKCLLLELFAVFRVLSTTGFRWGLERMAPETVEELAASVKAQEEAVRGRDWAGAIAATMQFNELIYDAAGNSQLCKLLRQMSRAFQRVSLILRPSQERVGQLAIYRKMLKAVRQGHHPEVIALYTQMMDSFEPLLRSLPDEDEGSKAPMRMDAT